MAFFTPTPSTRRLALWTGDSSTAGWGEEGKVRGASQRLFLFPGLLPGGCKALERSTSHNSQWLGSYWVPPLGRPRHRVPAMKPCHWQSHPPGLPPHLQEEYLGGQDPERGQGCYPQREWWALPTRKEQPRRAQAVLALPAKAGGSGVAATELVVAGDNTRKAGPQGPESALCSVCVRQVRPDHGSGRRCLALRWPLQRVCFHVGCAPSSWPGSSSAHPPVSTAARSCRCHSCGLSCGPPPP